jgi:3-keto-5-aminohexanoate cleavage enzyme
VAKGDKLIITAAVSGGATFKSNNPAVPYTPQEFADECEKCMRYGVSVVHIHARDTKTEFATADPAVIGATVEAIRKRCPDMIINLSTAITVGLTPEQRIAPIIELKPDIGSMNTATMNDGIADHKTGEVFFEYTFENKLGMIADFAKVMKQNGVKPEFEVYDPAGIYNIQLLSKQKDLFAAPLNFQFVYGAFGGIAFNPGLHLTMVDLLPEGSTFGVCGVGPNQVQAAVMSALTGGHVRIGLEDNIRAPGGELAKGSWEQAKWVQDLAAIMERPVATPAEAREILGLRRK